MKRFCCCSPFTLAYIIGWLGVVGCIFSLFSMILGKYVLQKNDENQNSIHSKITVTPLTITTCLGELLISILLIIGTSKRRRSFLLPWLIYQGIKLVLAFICMIMAVFVIIYFTANGKFDSGASFRAIIVLIICIALSVLGLRIWQVIRSLYHHLGENENGALIQQNIQNIESQAVEHASYTNHVDVSYQKF